MTTDKELADALRLAHYELLLRNFDEAAEVLNERIDALDPPKPEYPDGMHAIVTFKQRFDERSLAHYACRSQGVWAHPDGFMVCDDADVTKVEPLRVLADDEIALPRAAFNNCVALNDAERARNYAAELARQHFTTAPRVFRAYADALDAEAGEQS